jgi:hypothetical protein
LDDDHHLTGREKRGNTVISHEEMRASKKTQAIENLIKCIEQLRSFSTHHDVWPWFQITNALAAFDAGLYDLSVAHAQLAQVAKGRYRVLPKDMTNDVVKLSDLNEIERYLHSEKLKPAKPYPRFIATRFDSSRT